MTDHDEVTTTDVVPMELDPDRPMIISAWGRAGSGKSVFNRRIYRSWPFDKLAIDVNGDAEPGPFAEEIRPPFPKAFPRHQPGLGERRRYVNLHYRADPGSPSYVDDLDRAVGLALLPKDHRSLVWAGEVGELMPNGRTGPAMRRLLMQNRHYACTALFDGPRPVNVDPLVLAQSKLVAIFHLPNPDDRDRVAKSIGYPAKRFSEECEATTRKGPFWHLLWNADQHRLYRMAPLPDDLELIDGHAHQHAAAS